MRRTREPRVRLFVFHHAGGSHLSYRDWASHFPADWEVHVPDAPGRGPRDDRPVPGDAAALVASHLSTLRRRLTGPFAFFGHSLGALIAYELTRRLVEEGRTPPIWLGVSARSPLHAGHETAPQGAGGPRARGTAADAARTTDGVRPGRHLLSDDDLRREVGSMGGTAPEVLAHPQLWELFAPVIRADLRINETWHPPVAAAPLPVPLSVFGGTEDRVTPPHLLGGWSDASRAFLGLRLFDGGHFYFHDRLPEVARRIQDDVHRSLDPSPHGTAAAVTR
ncbi:thioesterase II family protein [Streptomyces sp. NPDC048566]|uniref:thioesterase II family protein n=1 Tax=Streptomyces sp. NPDC048566 TaxID=3365569 RepID=UPI0037238356